ncbi:hypothetical protein V565_102900, partial [Rhizoctonia solani 123E]
MAYVHKHARTFTRVTLARTFLTPQPLAPPVSRPKARAHRLASRPATAEQKICCQLLPQPRTGPLSHLLRAQTPRRVQLLFSTLQARAPEYQSRPRYHLARLQSAVPGLNLQNIHCRC